MSLPSFPTSLSQITLSQRIEYEELYGKELKASRPEIGESIEYFFWIADAACKALSFFSGEPLESIQTDYELSQVINAYTATLRVLLDEEADIVIEESYEWDDETWYLVPPGNEKGTLDITYETFVFYKSIIKDMMALSEGNWEVMPNLCALYLRKEGETLDTILEIYEERRNLFMNLTMDIVLAVGVFLNDTMLDYIKSLGLPKDWQESIVLE